MKKWIAAGIILVLAVAAVALLYTASHLGPIITNAVNTYGPGMTKTDVRLGGVKVSLLSGRASIENLFIGNPRGFKSGEALHVDSVHIDVDKTTLAGATVIIDRIEVENPRITYETKGGTDNFRTILGNIRSAARSGKTAGGKDKSKPGKKVIIRDLFIRNGTVTAAATPLGGVISMSLADIHLTNVGGGKSGVTFEEAFAAIAAELYAGISSPSVIGGIEGGVKQATGQGIEEGVNAVTGALKSVLGN